MNLDLARIAHHYTTEMWQWAVIPASNPYIYVPAPSREQATAIAVDLDKGTRPELYDWREVPEHLRVRMLLPDLPRMPARPKQFGRWQPVSEATAQALTGTVALTTSVEHDRRTVHLATVPVGMQVRRLACLTRHELEARGLALPATA
ncbi:hypothetical protein [Nocardia cyriacigeorgica]|uniref:hypothetical protein n=1 Tax=Nocardia cyriacigeorgica TaxID=135487 RepID=UPI0024540553|nr:hypothetical protein [Nocardia cyriacigeorgica]